MNTNPNQPALDPILVKNPNTGRFVNVASLFNTTKNVFGNKISEIANECDSTIRIIVTSPIAEHKIEEVRVAVYGLYELRDMFKAMTEYTENTH